MKYQFQVTRTFVIGCTVEVDADSMPQAEAEVERLTDLGLYDDHLIGLANDNGWDQDDTMVTCFEGSEEDDTYGSGAYRVVVAVPPAAGAVVAQ